MIKRFLCITISVLMLVCSVGCNRITEGKTEKSDVIKTTVGAIDDAIGDVEQTISAPALVDNDANEPEKCEQDESTTSTDKDVEVSNQIEENKNNICTLVVKCDTIFVNMDELKEEKRAFVPDNGIIFYGTEVEFISGESVFDVLKREMQKNKIHMEFNQSPVYKTAYIEGINNIYEFDCGDLSGWTYKVNGKNPGVGCSNIVVETNDCIEFLYTCDMGRDLRGEE